MKKNIIKYLIILTSILWLILPFFLLPIIGNKFNLIVKPLFWILTAVVSYFVLPKYSFKFSSKRYDVRQLALIGALVYIIIYFSSGLIIGYTKSPFNRSFMGILTNSWMIISVIICQEFIRDRLIKTSHGKKQFRNIILITLLFVLFDLNIHTMGNIFASFNSFMGFLIKTLLASLIIQSYTSYLAFRDSYKSALYFRIPYEFAFLITPIFPANIFIVLLIIETVIPLFIYLKIEKTYQKNSVFGLPPKESLFSKISRFITIIILIFLITFSMGLFSHSPIVIASNSMYPYIERGDIVIMKKTSFEDVKINDIIE